MRILLLVLFFLSVITFTTEAQTSELPLYNHYYVNPFFYNPAYIAGKTQAELSLTHRQQWWGVEGAPAFSQLSFIYPISRKIGVGLNVYNNKRGLLTTTSAQAALSYTVELGEDAFLGFGMSGGVGRNALDINSLGDVTDPALVRALDKSYFIEGKAGINLQIKKLNIGFALPKLFRQNTTSAESFQKIDFDALNTTITSISYRFDTGPFFSIQPLLLYRTENGTVSKNNWEAYTTLYYKDFLWAGGLYRQNYGASAYLGFTINKTFQVSYAYEFPTNDAKDLSLNTHEFRLGIKIGKQRASKKQKTATSKSTVNAVQEQNNLKQPVEEEMKEEKEDAINSVVSQPKPVQHKEEVIAEPIVKKEIKTSNRSEEVVVMDASKDPNELKKGVYVVVGVFGQEQNALRFVKQCELAGFKAKTGYSSGKRLHYVYIAGVKEIEEAHEMRDHLRKVDSFQFHDTWILLVR